MFGDTFVFYVSIVVLGIIFIAQLYKRSMVLKLARTLFFVSVIGIFGNLAYLSYAQFLAFKNGPLGFTISTGEGIRWFLGYIQLHFLNQFLISLIAAFIIIFIVQYLNKKRGGQFFEREELYVAVTGLFLVGYPGWLFYLGVMLVLPAIISIIFVRRGERLPLYYFWMPTAVVVLVWVQFFAMHQAWWTQFRF